MHVSQAQTICTSTSSYTVQAPVRVVVCFHLEMQNVYSKVFAATETGSLLKEQPKLPGTVATFICNRFRVQTKGRRERKRKGKEEEGKERGRERGKGKLEVKLWQKRKNRKRPSRESNPGPQQTRLMLYH